MIKSIFAGVIAIAVTVGAAFADDAPLTADQAKRFVATLPAVETLGKEFDAEGKTEKFVIDAQPKAGEEFKPYSNAVTVLKAKYPADYSRLDGVVKPQGFSAEKWGAAGDRVMVAYMALKMEKENPQAMAQMQAMDPSMMAMLPPEMKAQFEQVKVMMATISNASADDKKAVKEVEKDLDAYMNKADMHAGHH